MSWRTVGGVSALVAAALGASCKHPPPPAAVDAGPAASITAAPVATRESTASAAPPVPTPAASVAPATLPGDAGAGACALVWGPAKLATTGPVALAATATGVDVVQNDNGAAVHVAFALGKLDPKAKPVAPPAPADARRVSRQPCALAGSVAFCTDRSGGVHRAPVGGGAGPVVGHARPGAWVAASLVAGKPVVAFLRDRTTSEGNTQEAYLVDADGAEQRLSEDGSGATFVALAPRGEGAIAVYVDARMAMSPVHARTVAGAKPVLGKDEVLFIGGSAEATTRLAVGVQAGGPAFALVPISHDLAFSLAIARMDAGPTTDAPTTWSDYPNGLDPAPIAATAGAKRVTVARVRPSEARFGAPRVLELGRVDAGGGFAPLGLVSTHGAASHVAIVEDRGGGIVIGYTDGAGSWVERRSCK